MTSMAKIRRENMIDLLKTYSYVDAIELQSISRRLHKLDEYSCNYGIDEGSREEKLEVRLEKKASNIAAKYGMIAYHQSDPRGWSLYVGHQDELRGYDVDAAYDRLQAVCPH